ncbi:hypothetical protein C8F04DRAFT_1209977 [Mycena alexandri]|uniref:Peptidase M20 dimerisation domain-containing protein n=1 Tax=Mycena alexandri TaxID=1745969 RepID=A0AAD6X997_9AGAR|nr:hypothetical protein C8F04DRAFT_1209977 [Mycena alexandri]
MPLVSESKKPSSPRKRSPLPTFISACLFFVAVFLSTSAFLLGFSPPEFVVSLGQPPTSDICPQVAALFPIRNAPIWEATHEETTSNAFKARLAGWCGANSLTGICGTYRTESYDDMHPVGVDPCWLIFADFHAYLSRAFPLVHANLRLQKINTYGLLYEWTGSDNTLKPLLLAAHQDVVPVDPFTVGDWTHPPYSGHFDANLALSTHPAMYVNCTLLGDGFAPTRAFVAAFGFDEEVAGFEGAGELAKVLLNTYGEDSFAFIIDEGEGYLDVVVEVTSPGGHSSIPPDHTASVLAALLVRYEDNPYPIQLSRQSTPYHTFQCLARYARTMPPVVRDIILESATSDAALRTLEGILSKDRLYRSQIGTTQAVDVVSGGVKSNALPEEARAVVNHRVHLDSSLAAVRAHDTLLLQPLATRFNLTYTAFSVNMYALEPAPVTPTSGSEAAPYQLLAGSIRAAYHTRARRAAADSEDVDNEEDAVVVAPSIMSGNTYTRYYWNLSRHIFRYGHGNSAGVGPDEMLNGIHTVDESINADDFVEIIRFFVTLILNADESTVL